MESNQILCAPASSILDHVAFRNIHKNAHTLDKFYPNRLYTQNYVTLVKRKVYNQLVTRSLKARLLFKH